MEYIVTLSPLLIDFVLVILFSFSLGLQEHQRFANKKELQTFGTDRTFTLIGIFGFLMLVADVKHLILYTIGFVIIGIMLGIFYYEKITLNARFGMTSIILGLITYGFPLLIMNSPRWLSLLFFVVVIILTGMKDKLQKLSSKIESKEFTTLALFIIISGVILPILPSNNIPFLSISPYQIWLAVVAMSSISYFSYIFRKYVFPKSGLLITGILGGIYSSTATTIILSKKSKDDAHHANKYSGAIIMATAMMYIRIFALFFIFSKQAAITFLPFFLFLTITTILTALWIYNMTKNGEGTISNEIFKDKNPLEFNMAIIFSILYMAFSFLTDLIITRFGTEGLNLMSTLIGFVGIDPFLINLFQGHYAISSTVIVLATIQAMTSNNILKTVYALYFASHRAKRYLTIGFGAVLITNAFVIAFFYL
ncbi:MAG: hypothetical protein QG614_106 [Patescibacteria group bacterium]|nr:hypothetical protein [Patescibacteria group bacterium]